MQEENKKTDFISFLRANFLTSEDYTNILSTIEEDAITKNNVYSNETEDNQRVDKTLKNIKSHLIDLNFLLSLDSNLEHKIELEKKFFKHRYKSSNPGLLDKTIYKINHQRRLLNHNFNNWNPAMVTVGVMTVFILAMFFTVSAPNLSHRYTSRIDNLIQSAQEKHLSDKTRNYTEVNNDGYVVIDINDFQKVAGVKVSDLEKAGYTLSTEEEINFKDNFKKYVDKISEKQKEISTKMNKWLTDLLKD